MSLKMGKSSVREGHLVIWRLKVPVMRVHRSNSPFSDEQEKYMFLFIRKGELDRAVYTGHYLIFFRKKIFLFIKYNL